MAKVIIDAGHGGKEPGAIYGDRKEKDDTLRLALAVGEILKQNGVDVAFTRTEDVYNSPFEKAQTANREGGDFLISIHRNASPEPNQYSGVESLVFDRSGKKVELAENINRELAEAGYRNLGIKERPGLVILRRSQMPAVLVEVGFLNTDTDNVLFDRDFEGIAEAIAKGVLETLREDTKVQEVKWDRSSPALFLSAMTAALLPALTFTPSTAAIRFSPLRSSVMLPAMSSSIFLILRLPIPCSIMQ